MGILVRAVVTGFGLAMGAAIFKKVAPYVNLDEKKASTTPEDVVQRGDGDGRLDGGGDVTVLS